MANNQRNHKFDPLDPFYSEEIDYETSGIRRSKANQLKRATSKPASAPIVHEKKKVSFLSRIITFFEELPNRADRYRIYRMAVMVFALIVGLFLVVFFIIAPLIREQSKNAEIEVATKLNNDVSDFLITNQKDPVGLEEEKNAKIVELKNLYDKSVNNPEAQYEYAIALLRIYEADGDIASIELLTEQFMSNENLAFPTNAYFLIALKGTYFSQDNYAKYKETIEKLLQLPDDNQYNFNSATFTEEKEVLKSELERLKAEESI